MKLTAAIKVIAFSGLFLCSYYTNSQSCYCPPVSSCAACNGGLSSLTLIFNGSVASTITAYELAGTSQVYSGIVNPGGSFTFTSTIPSQKFGGVLITTFVNGIPDASINTVCGTTVQPGDIIGSFTVASASSLNGGIICCSTATETTPPVISGCPSNISISTNASACSAVVTWTAPTATDNCTLASFTPNHNPNETFPLGVTSVIYTATDSYGNTATCSFTVTVTDNTAPVFSTFPPNDIPVFADGSCQGTASWTVPTATDNCGSPMITQTAGPVSGSTNFPIGVTTITYEARDAANNITTSSFTVTVTDNIAPVFATFPPNDIPVFADANCQGTATWATPTAIDNCGSPTITQTAGPVSGATNFPIGVTTITYEARDAANNVTLKSFTVTVTDNIAPVFATFPPNDIPVFANGSCQGTATWATPTATDNCGSTTITQTVGPVSGSTNFPIGVTTITYEARDAANNVTTRSFTVTVTDNVAPVFATFPPNDIPVLADGNCQGTASWTVPTATDNCGSPTITQTAGPASGSTNFPIGVTTITYEGRDAANNVTTRSFTVTVTDNTAPIITGYGDVTFFADASCQSKATWPAPIVTDNCSPTSSITITQDHTSGEIFSLGTTRVTYTATDASGNKQTISFNVIVKDNVAPSITGCPSDITLPAEASCQANVSWTLPTASDNCTLASLTSSHAPGLFPVGITTVTYTAIDNSGNKQTCSFNIHITGVSPEINGCPDDIVVNANENGTVAVSWTEPVGSVQCGNLSVKKSHEPGSTFPIGISTIVYEFTDDYGNSSKCTFHVSVLEHEALFAIAKAVTPDGDGVNDVWVLTNIEKYSDNTVLIVDRWGNKIYSATGYDNESVVWKATNTNGAPVPTGTYFYKVEVQTKGQVILKTGFLEVIQ